MSTTTTTPEQPRPDESVTDPASAAKPTEQPPGDESFDPAARNTIKAAREERNAADRARKAAERERDELKTQLQKAHEKEMSDLERAQSERDRYAREADAARLEALRYRVAAKHQISDEDAATFLTAADEDGITRQATRLSELSKARVEQEAAAVAAAGAPRTPAPDPSQGSRTGNSVGPSEAEGVAEAERRYGKRAIQPA